MLLGDVIYQFRMEHGKMSLKEFSKCSGLSVAYINQLENNRNPKTNEPIVPSLETFIKVSKGMGITLDSLLSKVDENQPVGLQDLKTTNHYNDFKETIDNLPTNAILPAAQSVPIMGTICAGTGRICEDDYQGHFVIDVDCKADYCLKVKGDSMIGANIFDGDIVFIAKSFDFETGEIYAVENLDTGEASLKRVHQDGASLVLAPCNPEYTPTVTDHSEVRIAGKCVGVFHKYI